MGALLALLRMITRKMLSQLIIWGVTCMLQQQVEAVVGAIVDLVRVGSWGWETTFITAIIQWEPAC